RAAGEAVNPQALEYDATGGDSRGGLGLIDADGGDERGAVVDAIGGVGGAVAVGDPGRPDGGTARYQPRGPPGGGARGGARRGPAIVAAVAGDVSGVHRAIGPGAGLGIVGAAVVEHGRRGHHADGVGDDEVVGVVGEHDADRAAGDQEDPQALECN